jgi:hypothetical protein
MWRGGGRIMARGGRSLHTLANGGRSGSVKNGREKKTGYEGECKAYGENRTHFYTHCPAV